MQHLPPAFAQTMTGLAGTNIFLEDSFGARWRVLVCMKMSSLAFGRGWCEFMRDHSIEAGEFLAFRKVCKSIFSVQIFSTTGCERLNFCETKKRSQHQRQRTVNFVPNTRPRESTKNGHIPTIQEATRREESRARRTNAVMRRRIMEDIADENLLVKDELPIIAPIATVPSDHPLSLCSSQNAERLAMNAATCPLVECLDRPEDFAIISTRRNAEINGTVCNGIKRGKCETGSITTNKKLKCLEKIIGEDQNIIQENNCGHNAASETQTDMQLSVPIEDKVTISAREHEAPELKNGTFTISASVTSQSWLELPERLPLTIGKNKMGRKVVILRDPSMRFWPVLYYESSKFVGFIDGWEEFKRANDICAGKVCEFEFYSVSEDVLQVRISNKLVAVQTSN
ncbi:B3 domain-containing protein [Rhynchospora pubera]|uniref:B3 domain-containing protein n=1 Tax=Rhynchospora pubera TaxID=906938 RepID=A0AAV8BY64_9POAL|nr:B3 domain-containing protein [Rhynchospora pubera]